MQTSFVYNIIHNYPKDTFLYNCKIDVFSQNLNSWVSGNVIRIRQPNIDFRTYFLDINYDNWSGYSDGDIIIRLEDLEENPDGLNGLRDDRDYIAKYKTKAFSGWGMSFSDPCRVLFYKKEKWYDADIIHSDINMVEIRLRHSRGFNVIEERYGSPAIQPFCFKKNIIEGGKHYNRFQKIEKVIKNYYINEKKRKQEEKKQKQKRCTERIREYIKLHPNEELINSDTVKMCKMYPNICLKSCYAYKRGWINRFGYPKSWSKLPDIISSKFHKLMPIIHQNIGSFLDIHSIFEYSLLNKTAAFSLHHEHFLSIIETQAVHSLKKYTNNLKLVHRKLLKINNSFFWKKMDKNFMDISMCGTLPDLLSLGCNNYDYTKFSKIFGNMIEEFEYNAKHLITNKDKMIVLYKKFEYYNERRNELINILDYTSEALSGYRKIWFKWNKLTLLDSYGFKMESMQNCIEIK